MSRRGIGGRVLYDEDDLYDDDDGAYDDNCASFEGG